MKYSIGIALDNYDMLDITSNEIETLHGDTIIVLLDDKSNTMLHEYYSGVRKLIINGNKVMVILDGDKSKIRKHISMLMVSYDMYDIYNVTDVSDIDNEYIQTLEERKPTIEEVTEYIGADISSYASINELLLSMENAVKKDKVDEMKNIVYENMELIENAVAVVDYMKRVVDSANSGTNKKIDELKDELEVLKRKSKEDSIKMDKLKRDLEESQEENKGLERETNLAVKRCQELEDQVNKSGPVIRAYSTLQTSTIKGFKPKSIIYFKEISKIPYINSLVMSLMDSINSLHSELKARLIIYDNTSEYQVYKPITVVDSNILSNSREKIINSNDKIVMAEPNQSVLEDITKTNYDVIIIYDRLKQQRDLISGNLVFKFYVANSNKDIQAIKALDTSMDISRVIAPPSITAGGCMILPTIADYKAKSKAAKLAAYMKVGSNKNARLIPKIHEIAHIDKM